MVCYGKLRLKVDLDKLELTVDMTIKIDRFNELVRDANDFKNIRIKTHIPNPTDGDYKIGYIQRYFAQKANDGASFVFEVNEGQFERISQSPFYKTVELAWKISGNREEVREMNRKSIRFVTPQMKSIGLYVPNHLQFHKERV
jgi:hypothetical protein